MLGSRYVWYTHLYLCYSRLFYVWHVNVCRYIYIYTVYACHAQPTCSQSRCSRYLDRPQLLAEAMAGGMVVGSSPCWCLQFFQMVPRFINDMGFSSDSIWKIDLFWGWEDLLMTWVFPVASYERYIDLFWGWEDLSMTWVFPVASYER